MNPTPSSSPSPSSSPLRETLSVLVDRDHPPLRSPNTRAVAASLIFGGQLTPDGYLDTVEEDRDRKARHTTVWILREKEITFPAFAGETVSQGEFLKRWRDREWIAANPDHPISNAVHLLQQIDVLRDFINGKPSSIRLIRGSRSAVIDMEWAPDGTARPSAEGKKILDRFNG